MSGKKRSITTIRKSAALIAQHRDLFTDLYDMKAAMALAEREPQAVAWLLRVYPLTESPAERRLALAMAYWGVFPDAQVTVGNYRADFAFASRKIAIEVDGNEHHSSQEDRARDAQRDRFFISLGWKVVRFTGLEVWHHPNECADTVCSIVRGTEIPEKHTAAIMQTITKIKEEREKKEELRAPRYGKDY